VACDCRRMLAGTSSLVIFGALFVGAMDVEDDGMNSPRSLAQLPSACLISVLHLCFTRITESVLQTTSVCRFLQDRTICMLVGGSVGFVVGGLNWCDTRPISLATPLWAGDAKGGFAPPCVKVF
jgi:hypothetical protein